MLTTNELKSQEALSGLTDEQYDAIAGILKTTVDKAVAVQLRETHDMYDKDIREITGLDKPIDKKSYEFNRQVLSSYRDNVETLKSEVEKYKADIAELSNKSPDDALKSELESAKNSIQALNDKISELNMAHKSELENMQRQNFEANINSIQSGVLSQLKFSDNYDSFAQDSFSKQAIAEVMSMGTPQISQVNGKDEIVFVDENNTPIADPSDITKPLTFGKAVVGKLSNYLVGNDKKSGLGNKAKPDNTSRSNGNFSTKVEAMRYIEDTLATQGVAYGSEQFQERKDAMYKELGVGELPVR